MQRVLVQARFLHLGGYHLLSHQLATVATAMRAAREPRSSPMKATAAADARCRGTETDGINAHAAAAGADADAEGISLWCTGEVSDRAGEEMGLEVEEMDWASHEYKTLNLLLDLVFLGNRFITHPHPVSILFCQ